MAKKKEKPLTREDVLRLIKENKGTAMGLDLSGKTLEPGIDLRGLNLRGVILTGAHLSSAHLEGAHLRRAHLEGAVLRGAHLEKADLRDANLQGAHLLNARLQEARLRRAQLQEANLTSAHLERAILRLANLDGARLRFIHLEGADLRDANLQRTDLLYAHLEEAHLQHAQLQEANLTRAHLEKANLDDVEFSYDTKFVRVYWGDYIIGEERKKQFLRAGDVYGRLKMWYTNTGSYDIAGNFFYRQQEASRKRIQVQIKQQFKPKMSLNLFWFWIYRLICGYGEKPWRVVVWGLLVLLGSALLYFFLRGVAPYTLTVEAFSSSLYYSAVSFTALGYGPWFSASSVRSWVQGVGAAEAIVGVFMIALFLVTFTRKMTR